MLKHAIDVDFATETVLHMPQMLNLLIDYFDKHVVDVKNTDINSNNYYSYTQLLQIKDELDIDFGFSLTNGLLQYIETQDNSALCIENIMEFRVYFFYKCEDFNHKLIQKNYTIDEQMEHGFEGLIVRKTAFPHIFAKYVDDITDENTDLNAEKKNYVLLGEEDPLHIFEIIDESSDFYLLCNYNDVQ